MKLREAERLLESAGIEDARDEARMIFELVGGVPRIDLVSLDIEADDSLVGDAIAKRCGRMPLAYAVGKAYFYREEYKVNESCLIPRSDTEILVDFAVKNVTRGGTFLDLCTGSGCIALSVLNNTKDTSAVAADLSDAALSIAKENAESLGLSERVSFVKLDVLKEKLDGKFDAILSNPPYVTDGEYEALEPEIYFEPKSAFVGGADGGDFYRILTPTYKESLCEGGFIAYEIGATQGELIRKIAEKNGMSCEIIKDLGGRDRVAVLKKK